MDERYPREDKKVAVIVIAVVIVFVDLLILSQSLTNFVQNFADVLQLLEMLSLIGTFAEYLGRWSNFHESKLRRADFHRRCAIPHTLNQIQHLFRVSNNKMSRNH